MPTGFIPNIETQYAMDTLYAGETAAIALCSGSSWGKNLTVAQVIASELASGANGYERVTVAIGAAAQDVPNARYIAQADPNDFIASGGSIIWDGTVAVIGGSAIGNRLITGCSPASNYLETGAAHNLVNDEPLMITTDSPGVNPGGVSSTVLLYGIVVNSTRFQVAAAPGGAAIDITDIGSIGSQPTRLRYAKGRIFAGYRPASPQTILAGQSQPVPFNLATFNAGYGSGV